MLSFNCQAMATVRKIIAKSERIKHAEVATHNCNILAGDKN